jgi:hypothetical protein
MKLISELLRLKESAMSDKHVELQELIASKFKLSDADSTDVLDFATGDTDWYELSDEARDTLYNHYAPDMPFGMAKATTGDPIEFILKTLQKDLKL